MAMNCLGISFLFLFLSLGFACGGTLRRRAGQVGESFAWNDANCDKIEESNLWENDGCECINPYFFIQIRNNCGRGTKKAYVQYARLIDNGAKYAVFESSSLIEEGGTWNVDNSQTVVISCVTIKYCDDIFSWWCTGWEEYHIEEDNVGSGTLGYTLELCND